MRRVILWAVTFVIALIAASQRVKGADSPAVEARAAILVDFETGRVLWAKNADEPLAMASTTKIMTGILTLEHGNLSDTVTVSKRAAGAPKVKMNLSEGERISLETLLYALMLQSSNDAAVAVAEHIGGSVEGFCAMMTEKAKELGAKDTVFETPNGLDAGNHHSTAADLALIARYALSDPRFVDLINTPSYSGDSDRRHYDITNKNRFLHEFAGANGVKTGFTGKAGHCFVGSAERDGLWLVSVVLASGWGDRGKAQKWVDTKRVMNYGFDNYHIETIINDGDEAGSVRVERSKTPEITGVFRDTLRLPMREDEMSGVTLDTRLPEILRAPINPGDKLGICAVYIGGEKYTEMDVLAASGAERHDLKTSMEKVMGHIFELLTNKDVEVTLPEF
ncbi:MAG: D-alanyl-D-alanine carboxypeptidase [Clostridiales bacterium]|jgi:D-alanyl-D-alanine carboxypeptidase (penicillin-binding protein 5/6)|nr:D-alanyl-D-alanine carboxypeptidase [Clostridiales bacterium]